MKRFAIVPTAFALVAMLAACTDASAPDAAGPLFRHGGDHTVPIKGDFAYSTIGNTPVNCVPFFRAEDVSGPGKTSHLGKSAFAFTAGSCAADFVTETLTVLGSITLTGANGDAIFFGSSTVAFDISEVLAQTSLLGALEFTGEITGGTGRFAGATGSVSGTGVNDFSTASGSFSFKGRISSVGSLKQ